MTCYAMSKAETRTGRPIDVLTTEVTVNCADGAVSRTPDGNAFRNPTACKVL